MLGCIIGLVGYQMRQSGVGASSPGEHGQTHGGNRMSAGEHKLDVNQDAKPASQPIHTGGTVKSTSHNISQSLPRSGSGIVRAQGDAVMVPFPPRNLASQAIKEGVSSVDGGGLVLTHVNVYLVYWGTAWAQNPTPSADNITRSVASILAGPYMSALAQYRNVGSGTLYGTMLVTTSEPPKTFSSDDVSNLLKDLINMETVPGQNDVDQLLYCVIMPVGVSSDQSNVIGEHFSPGEDILCAWVMNDGTLDSVTTIFSHELVEACTNPNGEGYQFDAPGQCSASPINWCEIGDICEGIRDDVNGVIVQEYWSASDSACIAPGSTVTN